MTNSSNGEGTNVTCPVCLEHSKSECLDAQGLVVSAAEAICNGDKETIKAAFATATQYDFHIAVSMWLDCLMALAELADMDFEVLLADQRRQINEAFARGTGDSGSADPA